MASVQLSNVTFGYGERALFRGLNLELAQGKVTGIIGPNGCGKSSLLKLASGICKPWEGSIHVLGRDVSALSSKERARLLSLLAQEHAAPPMSVRRLVECGRFPHHGIFATMDAADCRAVDRALEACRLAEIAERPVAELSGGQRQRVFIAMILAQDAPVVLFDEPTSFLDVSACYEVMELMRSLKEEHGKTVVAVIHDINLALKYSDEVCVMRAGKPLAQGAPHEAAVLAAVEDAFDVRVELLHGELGSSYALWRRTER